MKYSILFFLCIFSNILSGKLASSSWDNLLRKSQVIVFAQAKEIKFMGSDGGESKLKVLDVVKGEYTKKYITIHWRNEEHDQRIYQANSRYVLFLRKNKKGHFIGTTYGRSFWKVEQEYKDDDWKDTIKIDYPLTHIAGIPKSIINSYYKENCGVLSHQESNEIYLPSLLLFIKKMAHGS